MLAVGLRSPRGESVPQALQPVLEVLRFRGGLGGLREGIERMAWLRQRVSQFRGHALGFRCLDFPACGDEPGSQLIGAPRQRRLQQPFDLPIEAGDRFVQRLDPPLGIRRVDADLAHVGRIQDAEQRVVVGRRDRIELVVVAAGAGDCQALRGLGKHVDLVVDLVGPRLDRIGRRVQHLPQPVHARGDGIDEMRPVGGKPGRQQIPGQLLPQEPVIRQIGVEGLDDVVPVPPGVELVVVELVPVGLRPTHQIQPVAAPALPVVRRGKQPLHQPFVGVAARIVQEGRDLGGRRRQARQVERRAPDQRSAVRLGRGPQAVRLHPGQEELVHRRPGPGSLVGPGRRRSGDRAETPETPTLRQIDLFPRGWRRNCGTRVGRAHPDPRLKIGDFPLRELAVRRHAQLQRSVGNRLEQQARGRIARLDRGAPAASAQQRVARIHPQVAHRRHLGTVAGEALGGQEGPDPLLEELERVRVLGQGRARERRKAQSKQSPCKHGVLPLR